MEGKVAVVYARYSSHNQRDVSIEQQVGACRKYADSMGLSVIRIYDDHALTGKNDNRPQFQQMLKDAASEAFDYVIVYSTDRFSRNKYDSAVHKHELKTHGVKVLSATENFTDDPMGTMMETIMEGFAQYYSEELAMKIKRGMRNNAEKCIVLTRTPLGYDKGPDGKYVINQKEALIVQEIFHRVSQKEPFVRIFEDLNARGILTKHGKKWDRSAFNKLLSNEKYIGVYTYEDIRIEDGIPPIIEKSLFSPVQASVTQKPKARDSVQKRRRENGVYLLTGKLFCGECGSPMVGSSGTSKSGKIHYYYGCKNAVGKDKSCSKKKVQRDLIEELVAAHVYTIISQPETAARIADDLIKYMSEHQETDEMIMLSNRLSDIKKEIANIIDAVRKGVSSTHLTQALEELEQEESSLKARYILAKDRAKMDITRGDILAMIELFKDGDIHDKSFQEKLIDTFVVKVYLYDDHLKVITNYSGSSEGITIPFNITEVEDKASETFEVSEDLATGVRIDSSNLHQSHLIRTLRVYLICGLAVLVSRLPERK